VETAHQTLHLDKRSLVKWKVMDIPTSFIWIMLFNGAVEYGGGIFKLLRWMRKLYQWMWGHDLQRGVRSSKDEQLLIRPLLQKKQKYVHGG
jgi:hypothetical protein